MARPRIRYRTLAALVLLGILVCVFVSLGNWQLRRAGERVALAQAIDAGRARAPLPLSASTPEAQLQAWRPATARGVWRDALSVVIENRNHDGRPGYWIATPLMLSDSTAILVLRGWAPRFGGTSAVPRVPSGEAGEQTVRGELLARVPRLFDLGIWGGQTAQLPARLPAAAVPVVQNLDLTDYGRATGLKLLPAVLAQTAAPVPVHTASGAQSKPSDIEQSLVYDWPEPSLDADRNRGYALQWFGFATIAALAWLAIAWRMLRQRGKS